ncbi:MAG: glycogen/starch/alpha-glucan phosphorylase [Candidatus Wallbacteria bacterium]|nr:glycogen/starch/alpha-glucan phosphorylase [Candidatus Wallbacteria bacterium]
MNKIHDFQAFYCGSNVETVKQSIMHALKYWLGKDKYSATDYDWFMACAFSIRNRVIERWSETQSHYYEVDAKRVYYMSLEFLIGRLMGNNLYNLGIYDLYSKALTGLGYDILKIRDLEKDAGLGNGGLGRLAACFLDSMTTMSLPAYGYGIRYEFGIFRQTVENGWQVEEPDEWLAQGNPWEIVRPEFAQTVEFGGRVEEFTDETGSRRYRWVGTQKVKGMAYDTPVVGYGTDNVNTLRLWAAKAHEQFDFQLFSHGDYVKAVEEKNISENISKVLYPNDDVIQGKTLRLKQEFFFVSCTIKDIIRRFRKMHKDFTRFKEKVAIQLNDTHPALAIPEMMRILLDEERLGWDHAWDLTKGVFGYTNHTLLPEALEKWNLELMKEWLPRHVMIIFEINHRFMKQVSIKFPTDSERMARMSIIEEGPDKKLRMAHLAMAGSHSVNGVSALHTELIKTRLARDFYEMWPERFNNKTNGITPRRWLLKANRGLADLISGRIGDNWITDLGQLKKLVNLAEKKDFAGAFTAVKRSNKERLAGYIADNNGINVNPDSIFDVQAKRLHEYKRQLLNALHVIEMYLRVKDNPGLDIVPRTFIFSAKAAPGYAMAKLIIKFINSIAEVVNNDPDIREKLKVVFLADYRVTLAEILIPAADVSEQISTAGLEASGTGNMKFMLNGALTLGTLDGANVEIREEVGDENIYIFGKTASEIEGLRGRYNPHKVLESDPSLKRIFGLIESGFFSLDNKELFRPILSSLTEGGDRFFVLEDFASYREAQQRIDQDYRNRSLWARKTIFNTALSGKFSSDRTIGEYAAEIWGAKPEPVNAETCHQEEKEAEAGD